jgi:subtilase family serine protease
VTVDNPDAVEGDSVRLRAQVGNAGDSTAYDFDVWFGIDGSGYTENPHVSVAELMGGASASIEHPDRWAVDYSNCSLRVFVDSGNAVGEYNEANNSALVPLPYDFYPVYGSRCPGEYPYGTPHFFDVCEQLTGHNVTISLSARNSGILNYNGYLQFNVYDSLAGSPARELIGSESVSGTYLNHRGSLIVQGFTHSFPLPGLHFVIIEINEDEAVAECNNSNNTAVDTIRIHPTRPDLVMQSEWILLSSLNPGLGDTLCIENADVYNQGDTTAFDVEVLFFIDDDTLGDIVVIDSVPNFVPDNYRPSAPAECVVIDTCEPSAGIAHVRVDPFGQIDELDETNNRGTKSFLVCEAPELFIKRLYIEPVCAGVGRAVDIVAVVSDTGNASASAILEFYYLDDPLDSWADTIYIATAGVDNIPLDDSASVSVPWQMALDSTYIYAEIVYSYPYDYYAGNNNASAFFSACECGDADDSGSIDIDDVVYLIQYIFAGGPPPDPYQAGDVDCSGGIDIDDVVYLINYIFLDGYAPCDIDGDGFPDC